MIICRRCVISGRVQGVFYRASARFEAQQLQLTGYARNLQDGRVEVLACGDRLSVDKFCDWLVKGPAQAEVENVHCEVALENPPEIFSID